MKDLGVIQQILQEGKSKRSPEDVYMDLEYLFLQKQLVSSKEDFEKKPIPWIFDMLDRIEEENEAMKRERDKMRRKNVQRKY